MTTTLTVGERVKKSREQRGLTQQQLADAAGITAAAIGLMEIGNTKNISAPNLFPIARALQKNPQWLATGDGPEDANESLDEIINSLSAPERVEALDYLQYKVSTSTAARTEQTRATYITTLERLKGTRDESTE